MKTSGRRAANAPRTFWARSAALRNACVAVSRIRHRLLAIIFAGAVRASRRANHSAWLNCRSRSRAGKSGTGTTQSTLVHSIRHWTGAFHFELGGLDALVFTAGIGENGVAIRAAVCRGLEPFGIHLDAAKNAACAATEALISTDTSAVKILVIPANEELVLAREVFRKLS